MAPPQPCTTDSSPAFPSQLPDDELSRFTVPPLRLEDLKPLPGDPPGLSMACDIISPEHERALIDLFRTRLQWPSRATPLSPPATTGNAKLSRLSLHYGYHFCYKTFAIDRAVPFEPFPAWLAPLVPTCRGQPPAQVCLQYYPPGAGIPPHVDTHSAFDELCGLSIGAPVQMHFRRGKGRGRGSGQGEEVVGRGTTNDECNNQDKDGGADREKGEGGQENFPTSTAAPDINIDLSPRSLLRMDGDARLHWMHGIRKRKTDEIDDGTVRPRGDRWSITFRWLRRSADGAQCECECGNAELCDSEQRRRGVEKYYRWKGETASDNGTVLMVAPA